MESNQYPSKFTKTLMATTLLLLILVGYSLDLYLFLTRSLEAAKLEIQRLSSELTLATSTNAKLAQNLEGEKSRNDGFERQINQISGTVGTLQKLSQTDKELLQKYSKVYFLNENYKPKNLSAISPDYLLNQDKPLQIQTQVWPFLEKLLKAAESDDTSLQIVSAYRSFGEQTSLKNNYKTIYGSGANSFSADQGYSEHQLGTTVDFTTPELGANYSVFDSSEGYDWLVKNAHRYGFILSYPKGNKYYQYEPWHWRFVGVDLARDLHDEGDFFYDLDQREIDKYLVSIFD